MKEQKLLYEGKAKQIYATEDPNLVMVTYKNDATAFNNLKKGQVDKKGELNNQISTLIFQFLASKGIPNHFVKQLSDKQQLVKKVNIIPLEIIVRNYVAGSMAKRLNIEEGTKTPETIFEICYKDDTLGDPLINDDHAIFLGIVSRKELQEMYKLAANINGLLKGIFDLANLILIDFKIEFGKDATGSIILADEISPDTCRLWDKNTKEKLDKDRFRRDLGQVTEAYEEVYKRLNQVCSL